MLRYRDCVGDTICSPITPLGYSGVAVIRISGQKAFRVTQKIIPHKSLEFKTHCSYLTAILDGEQRPIDQVLITTFEKGRSFTGDETVEVSCHGNPLLVNAITRRYLEQGCRTADPGEFSFRAYYNGKLDLVQAESIQSLVRTKQKGASCQFMGELQGQLSDRFRGIEDQLVHAMAQLEATIDFVEQDISPETFGFIESLVSQVKAEVVGLMESYDTGKNLLEDPKILLLGQTNGGKSSLFNQLVQSERAIVTEREGTTRDIITETRFLGHHPVQFMDSAGLRETLDLAESMGIERGLKQCEEASLILFVVDGKEPKALEVLRSLPEEKTLIVFNKRDLFKSLPEMMEICEKLLKKQQIPRVMETCHFVSSLRGVGIETLLSSIKNHFMSPALDHSEVFISQSRHFNHLKEVLSHLETSRELLKKEESPDLISQELLLALTEVHHILGKEYDDEVLDRIFSQFCIGK